MDQIGPLPTRLHDDRMRAILERAGFGEIDITAHDEQVGSGDLDAMLAVCSRVGALGKILRENPELRAATLPALRSALARSFVWVSRSSRVAAASRVLSTGGSGPD